MYTLFLMVKGTEKNVLVEEHILGKFPGSPFWTQCWEAAKLQYGEENIRYEWDETDRDTRSFTSEEWINQPKIKVLAANGEITCYARVVYRGSSAGIQVWESTPEVVELLKKEKLLLQFHNV
jgi:hypothetical protein